MAGTVTITRATHGFARNNSQPYVEVITIDWVADSAAATVPATEIPGVVGYLIKAVTNPGSVAPTDNYDITLVDPEGTVDSAQGKLIDRDTVNTEEVYFIVTGGPVPPLLAGNYTFTLANNSVNSATGRCVLYVAKI